MRFGVISGSRGLTDPLEGVHKFGLTLFKERVYMQDIGTLRKRAADGFTTRDPCSGAWSVGRPHGPMEIMGNL